MTDQGSRDGEKVQRDTVFSETRELTPVSAADLAAHGRDAIVRDLYRKHAAELLALEDAQQRTVLLVLGAFGAAASLLGSSNSAMWRGPVPRIAMTAAAAAILVVTWAYTHRRDAARRAIRDLMVRCEIALGLYEAGRYVKDKPLYPLAYRAFPKLGKWLAVSYWLAVMVGLAFLAVVWLA